MFGIINWVGEKQKSENEEKMAVYNYIGEWS